ncbi:RHS repeat-associated core domain-containing protein [Streptomyces sp. SID14478]
MFHDRELQRISGPVSLGLIHFQARYYDPDIGRFTQPDPSGQE